jgi:hypothetical protein
MRQWGKVEFDRFNMLANLKLKGESFMRDLEWRFPVGHFDLNGGRQDGSAYLEGVGEPLVYEAIVGSTVNEELTIIIQ